MQFLFRNSVYLGAGLALISAGLIAAWLLVSPSASNLSNASGAADGKSANSQKTQIAAQPDGTAFRYGPEVNHGRSDTPVYARAQALKEAGEIAPTDQRRATYQGRRAQRSGTATFFSRGLSSGH